MRPTTDRVREAWMSALGGSVVDATVVDLFAGSGALGLEALSRGARRVVFVERARGALRCLEQNVERLGASGECRIVHGDALAFVKRLSSREYDIALADPPYGEGLAEGLVARFGEVPFAHELWVEHRASDEISAPPEARQRRYGDTVLTTLQAPT